MASASVPLSCSRYRLEGAAIGIEARGTRRYLDSSYLTTMDERRSIIPQ